MHPVECNTVGLYKTPVAILDFASLYPSLYRAHNLCYSTLVHPDDVTSLPPEHTTEVLRPKANVKSHFVKPGLRKGILPSILAALIEARATTRAALKEASDTGVLLCALGCTERSKEYTFRHSFKEKPGNIPGLPEIPDLTIAALSYLSTTAAHLVQPGHCCLPHGHLRLL